MSSHLAPARIARARRSPSSWLRRSAGVLLTSALVLAGTLGITSSASAANARGVVNLYAGPAPYFKLIAGTWPNGYLTMHCWIDYAWANGTNRWFLVSGLAWNPYSGRLNYATGYANANQVANQQRVGHC